MEVVGAIGRQSDVAVVVDVKVVPCVVGWLAGLVV